MIPQLGRLSAVELRDAWSSEAQDFTPWLAQPANLALLGDTLDLQLEVDSVEKPVGPYRADILCREAGTDRLVLIENQIEATDHRHLGQLLTYAAGLDTAVVCWLARRFSIVAQPNEWRRAVAKGASRVRADEPAGIDVNRVAYWAAFEQALERRNGPIRPKGRPPRQGYYFFKMAHDVFLYVFRNVATSEIGVYLGLYGATSRPVFDLLIVEREAIEDALSSSLDWRIVVPERKYWLMQRRADADPLDEADWPGQHEWLIERLERFSSVFGGRVERILRELKAEAP